MKDLKFLLQRLRGMFHKVWVLLVLEYRHSERKHLVQTCVCLHPGKYYPGKCISCVWLTTSETWAVARYVTAAVLQWPCSHWDSDQLMGVVWKVALWLSGVRWHCELIVGGVGSTSTSFSQEHRQASLLMTELQPQWWKPTIFWLIHSCNNCSSPHKMVELVCVINIGGA